MQHDDVIWQSIHNHFCSYKVTTSRSKFCRNKYNLTGICERLSCPLANSRYATIVENDDRLYLFVKTVERAHSPRRLWERIRLSQNYRQALKQIDHHLQYWPQFYIHKAKQRMTKMTQYIIRKNRMALQAKSRLVGVKKKVERREISREAKANRAAKLEESIEKELVERLKSGTYGDIYNFDQDAYENALDAHLEDEMQDQQLEDDQLADGEMELEEDDEYEARLEDSDDDDYDDIEQGGPQSPSAQFDFDDDDDDDDDDSNDDGIAYDDNNDDGDDDDDERGSDEIDDEESKTKAVRDGKGLPKRPRNAKELDEYVREKARHRATSTKMKPSKGIRKKGRKLRATREHDTTHIEMEYEHERGSNTAKHAHRR